MKTNSIINQKNFIRKRLASLVILFFSVSVVMMGQGQMIKLKQKTVTVHQLISEIEKQTKMSVDYGQNTLNLGATIKVNAKTEKLGTLLNLMLQGTGLEYSILSRHIIITKPKKKQTPQGGLPQNVSSKQVVKGKVLDSQGEPLLGVTVRVKGTQNAVVTNIDGAYAINANRGDVLEYSYIGFDTKESSVNGTEMNQILREDSKELTEVVVTAMGIQRKEKSLTYATQRVKAEDLMKVQDANVANSLEGKISGITITPNAGGAGGASKIILRGNKSILGNSTPLIVVDGIPYTNATHGQLGMNDGGKLTYEGIGEGSDPLSLINPDDIESMNVLKGANAAALYGSAAANGVIMITTKKGKEGKLDVNFTSNIMFENPLMTPQIQNVYGGTVDATSVSLSSWGDKITARADDQLIVKMPTDNKFGNTVRDIHLRNWAVNDLKDFYRTGYTTNNSISLSGGTEKIRTYFSYANSHANGMLHNNSYNRNTFAYRQTYNLMKRLSIDVSINYAQTITNNRPGGGTVLNPIYHMYTMPRNIDMGYYRSNYRNAEGHWTSEPRDIYIANSLGGFSLVKKTVELAGLCQEWPFLINGQNNPYWLLNMNTSNQREDKVNGYVMGRYELMDGLTLQARVSFDHDKYNKEAKRYATTFRPDSMVDFGQYWKDIYTTNEIYTDYLLSYNKLFGNAWNLSSTIGYVGHVISGEIQKTDVEATYIPSNKQMLSNRINLFMTNAGKEGATETLKISNWDRAVLFTAQLGWKDKIYVDGSYRRDWYRAFKQFKNRGTADNYGYFGVGANAILSSLAKLPQWISYMKYRVSYSEVGNSIPNIVYAKGKEDLETGSLTLSPYSRFKHPIPEKTKSFETGLEMSFFNSRLNVDLTYYNSMMQDLYMNATNASQKAEPINSGKVRNQGIESTISYDFMFGRDWRWRTSYNVSYNNNRILETAYENDGSEKRIYQDVAGVRVRYRKGGSIGDMYVTDFKRNADKTFALTNEGKTQMETETDKQYTVYAGNMNSKWQMGWSNNLQYKGFNLFFLINGRIGGKVISLTEAYLDNLGLSQRTADARLLAENNKIVAVNYGNQPGMILPDGSNRVVPIKAYYESLGGSSNPSQYIYNGTNFRLRELSMGYTFRNLMGAGRNITLSFIARNLFFIYKDCPTDPDVSLSTQNGLGAFELFNMPSSRSYGFSLKLNF